MVRVPELPLSMTAVDSNTPSSISATDICVRAASLEFIQLFRVGTQNPDGSRTSRRFARCLMRRRPSIEAAELPPIRGARQPLPKTARYRLVFLRSPVVPRWNGARGSRTPYLVRADGAQNDLDSTRRPGSSSPGDDAGRVRPV